MPVVWCVQGYTAFLHVESRVRCNYLLSVVNGEVIIFFFFEKHGVIKCHTTFVARTELQRKILKESDWNLIWQTVEKWSI